MLLHLCKQLLSLESRPQPPRTSRRASKNWSKNSLTRGRVGLGTEPPSTAGATAERNAQEEQDYCGRWYRLRFCLRQLSQLHEVFRSMFSDLAPATSNLPFRLRAVVNQKPKLKAEVVARLRHRSLLRANNPDEERFADYLAPPNIADGTKPRHRKKQEIK